MYNANFITNQDVASQVAKLGVAVCERLNALLGTTFVVGPVTNNWNQPFRQLSHDHKEHSFCVRITDPSLVVPMYLLLEGTVDHGRVGLLLEADGLNGKRFDKRGDNLNLADYGERMVAAIRQLPGPNYSHFNEHIGILEQHEVNVERVCRTVVMLVHHFDALKPVEA